MKKIAISHSSKSEEYLQPVTTRLKAHPDFDPLIFHPVPEGHKEAAFNLIYKRAEIFFDNNPTIDAVIIPSDRVEHLPVAIAAFHKNISIIQLYGGDISGNATFDDYNRYIYSIYASVVFCATEEAAKRIRLLYAILKKDPKHIYVSGMTHFDDIMIDETEIPDKPYDIVLYNPLTKGKDLHWNMQNELEEIGQLIRFSEKVLWIEPNEDVQRDYLIDRIKFWRDDLNTLYFEVPSEHKWGVQNVDRVTIIPRIERAKFLGLLKNCSRLISNSSMVFYESKKWLNDKQIIHIGERNKIREEVLITKGGSDKIIKILEGINFDEI